MSLKLKPIEPIGFALLSITMVSEKNRFVTIEPVACYECASAIPAQILSVVNVVLVVPASLGLLLAFPNKHSAVAS